MVADFYDRPLTSQEKLHRGKTTTVFPKNAAAYFKHYGHEIYNNMHFSFLFLDHRRKNPLFGCERKGWIIERFNGGEERGRKGTPKRKRKKKNQFDI